ncbi:MAG: CoA transferase [Dehalococcoidia bacterium]|nr:CoA transferase [Dehalococcoidia bacterium]
MTRPLSGIRVVDMSRVFAMPYCGAYLADLGAEVIKVESSHSRFMETTRLTNAPFPDNDPGERWWERNGTFQTLNRGKRSLTLDFRSEEALAILKRLVAVSDVVLENFTPRVMRRFGLDYPNLKAVKPDLIMVSNTGFGHSGPWSSFGAMASSLEPTHGTGAFMGYLEPDANGRLGPGSVPNKVGNSYTDFLATWTALFGVMACLVHRRRTGAGNWIDLAMYQVGVSFVGAGLLDFAFNGRRGRRPGNRHPAMAPHGCYPCKGPDEWVTLAVRDDTEWQSLCRVLGRPSLASDPRFADLLARIENHDALDAVISDWTSPRGQYEAARELQAAGIPAGPVLNARSMMSDPHLRARGFFEAAAHPPETGIGPREYMGRGWKLSQAAPRIGRPAPMLGEANDYALRQVLGLSAGEIDALKAADVVGDAPVGGGPPGTVPLDRQVDLGWLVDHDPDYKGHPEDSTTG